MDLGKRTDLVAFFLTILLAFLIGKNVVHKLSLKKIASINSQIEEERRKNELLGIISDLDKKLESYEQRSFTSTEITQVLDKISERAQEIGIEIETYNPLSPVQKKHYIELSVKMPLRCQYHSLGEFLSLLESNREFIWVKDLRMDRSRPGEYGQAAVHRVDLTISGFYLKQQEK